MDLQNDFLAASDLLLQGFHRARKNHLMMAAAAAGGRAAAAAGGRGILPGVARPTVMPPQLTQPAPAVELAG